MSTFSISTFDPFDLVVPTLDMNHTTRQTDIPSVCLVVWFISKVGNVIGIRNLYLSSVYLSLCGVTMTDRGRPSVSSLFSTRRNSSLLLYSRISEMQILCCYI